MKEENMTENGFLQALQALNYLNVFQDLQVFRFYLWIPWKYYLMKRLVEMNLFGMRLFVMMLSESQGLVVGLFAGLLVGLFN